MCHIGLCENGHEFWKNILDMARWFLGRRRAVLLKASELGLLRRIRFHFGRFNRLQEGLLQKKSWEEDNIIGDGE